jgi:hypothetical protein
MRPTAISGIKPDGLGRSGACACGQSSAQGSTALWGSIALVNAVLLAGAVYGVWKLVQYLDQEA